MDRRPGVRRGLVVAGLLLGLTACEGGDPVESALRDAAAARHAAATPTTAEVEARRPAPTADEAYVEAAIEQHRRSIVLAEQFLRESGDPETRRLAQAAIDSRRREIAELQAWRPAD